MDIKVNQRQTTSGSGSSVLADPANTNKRESEDVFDPASGPPSKRRIIPPVTLSASATVLAKNNNTESADKAATERITLESKVSHLITSKDNASDSARKLENLAKSAQDRGLPFTFTTDLTSRQVSEGEVIIHPFSKDYFEKIGNEGMYSSLRPVYLFFPDKGKAHYVGTIKECASNTHPTMGYITTFNALATETKTAFTDGILCGAGFGYLAFLHGVGVPKNKEVAANYLRLIPADERENIFGILLVEAIHEGHFSLALSCIPHSYGIRSQDEEGYNALIASLHPEAEQVLRRLIVDCKEQDLRLLADAKKYALECKYPRAAQILEAHAGTLGYTLDKE